MSGFRRSLVACGDVCSVTLGIQGLNPPGQGDEKDASGFTETFPKNHAYSKYLAAYRCGSAFPENGLPVHQDREKVGVTLVNW